MTIIQKSLSFSLKVTIIAFLYAIKVSAFPVSAIISNGMYVDKQVNTNTCWAAGCEMIIDYYYGWDAINQTTIVSFASNGNGTNFENCLDDACGGPFGCHIILQTKGNIQSTKQWLYPTMTTVATEISAGRPILWLWDYPAKHYVVVVGYNTKGNPVGQPLIDAKCLVTYNDPQIKLPGQYQMYYDLFVYEGGVRSYGGCLLMTTPARQNTVGIKDGITIDYIGPNPLFSQAQGGICNFQYGARFVQAENSTAHPTTWNWNMSFNYSGGKYLFAHEVNQPNLANDRAPYFLNYGCFLLPNNYPWQYDEKGNIMGEITVSTWDTDLIFHSSTIWAAYTPLNPFPGYVYYFDRIVASTQAMVKAHDWISLARDQLNPGTNISFKAGKTITIGNAVSISNGSIVNFTIDPALIN